MPRSSASRYRMGLPSLFIGLALFALLAAGPARAQAIIKVSDTVNIKFGVLLQPEVEWMQLANSANTDTIGYQQNLYVRRLRILTGGQVAKNVFFFAETENSYLGRSTSLTGSNKSLATGFQMLDAVVEWRIAKPFNLQGGLIRVPTSREALKSTGTELPIDFSAWAFLQSTPEQSTAGRDTGFMARGYFFNDRLEYRVLGLQGFRVAGSRNSLRFTSRLQYNFFDTELYAMPSYVSNYLGAKKILNIGGAADVQGDYESFSADAYASIPVSSGSVDGTLTFQSIDGGKFLVDLKKQQTYQAEILYYSKVAKLAPWIRWDAQDFSDPVVDKKSGQKKFWVGLTFLVLKNNFMIKTAYARIDPKTGPGLNQFQVMLHLYYF